MKYIHYRASDFAADEFFVRWVQQPTEESDAFWRKYMQEHPWQHAAINEARELVLHLSHDPFSEADAELDDIWQKLTEARHSHGKSGEETEVIPLHEPKFRLFWAAAAAVLLLLSGYLLFPKRDHTVSYASVDGERLLVRLPDSSMVVLNNNTTLTVSASWAPDKDRVVQLEGQAFFSVTHKHNNQKFIVEIADGVEVQVLGTEFSISDRGNFQEIILENGRVELSLNNKENEQTIAMVPGELVEVTKSSKVVKKKVHPELYNAWKSKKLVLDNKTLEEVAALLHHSYGYNVDITDPKLREKRITAYLDNNTPEHIISTLSETLELEIHRQNKNIIISSN